MFRPAAAALLLLVAAAGAAGCGTSGGGAAVPSTVKAPPQTARLGWEEAYPAERPALVFGVASFTVTRSGWTADISVENTSNVAWAVGGPRYAADRAFGVLLFPNDDLDELERRNRAGDLPAIRQATDYSPAFPDVLRPGKSWTGTISAPGALAGGLWARLSFGPLVSVGDAPEGARSPVVWFTDHAYRLREAEGAAA